MKKTLWILFAAFTVITLTWSVYLHYQSPPAGQEEVSSKKVVAGSFYVLEQFLRKVGGEHVVVLDFLPPGVDAHEVNPTPRDIARLQGVDLFVYQGADFDPWAVKLASNLAEQGKQVADMTEHFTLRQLEPGSEEGQQEGALDPHIWMDPVLAKQEAGIIRDILKDMMPQYAADFEANSQDYMKQLDFLHDDFRNGLAQCSLKEIIVTHDAYSYLAQRYGITLIPVKGLSPESEPSARNVGQISTLAKEKGIQYAFIEPLVNSSVTETIAKEIGAEVLILNPLEGLTSEEIANGDDYLSIMRENLANLRKAMKCQ